MSFRTVNETTGPYLLKVVGRLSQKPDDGHPQRRILGVEQGKTKGSEWWNDKLRIAVLQKRKVFEPELQQGSEQALGEYREERGRVRAVVRERQRMGLKQI